MEALKTPLLAILRLYCGGIAWEALGDFVFCKTERNGAKLKIGPKQGGGFSLTEEPVGKNETVLHEDDGFFPLLKKAASRLVERESDEQGFLSQLESLEARMTRLA